jgi:hypothetical protein
LLALLKINYFLVESAFILVLSIAFAAESVFNLALSAAIFELSDAFAVESVLLAELPEPLQAAKAPINNTNKIFFILIILGTGRPLTIACHMKKS